MFASVLYVQYRGSHGEPRFPFYVSYSIASGVYITQCVFTSTFLDLHASRSEHIIPHELLAFPEGRLGRSQQEGKEASASTVESEANGLGLDSAFSRTAKSVME